jgi:protein O-mannosyl-transferase
MSKKKKNIVARSAPEKNHGNIKKKSTPAYPTFVLKEYFLPLTLFCFFSISLYIQTVNFDYVLDDKIVITENKFTQGGIKNVGNIFKYESFRGYFGKQSGKLTGERYRPLSIASFAIEQSVFGNNKAISHLINVFLYALTGILLYRVLLFMFPANTWNRTRRWFFSIPFLATSLFLIHPLHVEVVANIKGRDEIFAFMGEMGVLYFSFRYLHEKKRQNLLFSFLSFCVAIFSKEGAITFIAIVPLTAYFFTRTPFKEKLIVTVPVLAGVFVYLLMRVYAIGYLFDNKVIPELINNPFYGMSFGEKTATIFYTLLLYLKLHIFPHPLTHDYYPYHIPVMRWVHWQPILSLLLHIGLIVFIIRKWKRKTVLAYAAAFYLIALSVVSNLIVPIGASMNERFVYHASLGFCIALAWFINRGFEIKSFQRWLAVTAVIILFPGFFIRTLIRVPDWRNDTTLESAAIKYSSNSARANCFYGVNIWQNVYMKLPPQTTPDRRTAVLDSLSPYFEKSLKLIPNYHAAIRMSAAVAAEYHKLDHNYDQLISRFEELSRNGSKEKYIIQYLQYLNKVVSLKSDAGKLLSYYSRMNEFYKNNFPETGFLQDYQELHASLSQRIPVMSQ